MSGAVAVGREDIPGCAACDDRQGSPWATKNGIVLWRCKSCGSLTAAIAPGNEPPASLYDGIYERNELEIPPAVNQSLRELVVAAERYRSTGRWLDFGFGAGTLLKEAERASWTCFGTEVSEVALEQGQRRGWRVARGLDDSTLEPGTFDVVTMIEVLEHLGKGRAELEKAARVLRPGGALYLTTPNGSSLNRRLLGRRWSIIAPPEHRTIWTPKGVQMALMRSGFGRIDVRATGLNPADLISRLRSLPQRAHSRVALGYQLTTALSSSRARRALKRAVNVCLSAFGIGDSLKVWAVRAP